MFENYKLSLLDFYWIKNKNHRLSINLEDPGREKIRIECVEVFLRKNTQKDKDLIRLVFDPKNQFDDQVRSIERFKLDKFRSLVSFMVEGTSIRDEKLVKLLAWLIDFPTYNEWRELSEEELKLIFEEAAKKPEEEITEPITTKPTGEVKVPDITSTPPPQPIFIMGKPTGGGNGEDVTRPEQPKQPVYVPKFSPRYITISCTILLFVSTTSLAVWERLPTPIRMPNAVEKFMYWDEDHYEPIKDDKQNVGTPIIPLNVQTLTRQRKINLPDTLTSYSIGKVWYKGYGKNHEFFTDSGAYPLDTQRVLKPLSNTILTKYISNYRYMLTRLVWFLCAAFFISICGIWASRLKKEEMAVRKPEEAAGTDTQSVLEAERIINGTELGTA
ncbi:hypothetical protein HDC90_001568 [Pedobacter sp. AK013]|uniref:hypothetical protein n=1 Tax=Pedobacter sp. AK013 TaxID=2723071 RepID=UPI00161F4005|nr:hypothetical protein [Pedobacter sp. AK013]MBB6236951.1 hypothetical protein [Pedobacter sp. AK013]